MGSLESSIEQLLRGTSRNGNNAPSQDIPTVDTAETIYISSLALLKVNYLNLANFIN